MTNNSLKRLLEVVEDLREEEFSDLDGGLVERILMAEWRLVEDRPRAMREVRDVIESLES